MTEKRASIRTDLEAKPQCTSRFAAMRCSLQSGHHGSHMHDGQAGIHYWGSPRRKR